MPTAKKVTTRAGLNELGRSGLKHFGGVLYEEFLPQLQGLRGMQVYREMSENSAIIGSMLFAIESLLRSVSWEVDPASQSAEDVEAAEFLTQCKDDMSHTWEDFISEVLSMLVYGWSYFEVVYKKRKGQKTNPASEYDDGRIGWRKFSLRAQDTLYRWELDDTGGIHGMWQYPVPQTPSSPHYRSMSETTFIPIEKSLLFRTTSTKNSPEGVSALRRAYRAWYLSKRIEEIEAIGVERDLAGIPIAKIPIELLAQDRSADQTATYNYIKDVVTKTKRDQQEGIIWPKVLDENGNDLFEFELLSTGSRRSFNTGEIVQRYHQEMVMVCMADFILLGHENVGSFALSSDKTELFAVALGAWLDMIQNVLNRHAVPRLFQLNNFNITEYPKFRHGDIETPDIQAVGAYIQALASAGAPLFPDLELENKLREYADLPEADPEERDRIMAAQQEASFFGAGQGEGGQGGQNGQSQNGQPQPPQAAQQPQPVAKFTKAQLADEILKRGGVASLRPSYFDGSRWKALRGRHRFLKELRDKAMAEE